MIWNTKLIELIVGLILSLLIIRMVHYSWLYVRLSIKYFELLYVVFRNFGSLKVELWIVLYFRLSLYLRCHKKISIYKIVKTRIFYFMLNLGLSQLLHFLNIPKIFVYGLVRVLHIVCVLLKKIKILFDLIYNSWHLWLLRLLFELSIFKILSFFFLFFPLLDVFKHSFIGFRKL